MCHKWKLDLQRTDTHTKPCNLLGLDFDSAERYNYENWVEDVALQPKDADVYLNITSNYTTTTSKL